MPTKADIPEWIRNNANVVIALFTIVIAVIAGIQACIYSSQLDEMREARRPWIGIKSACVNKASLGVCDSNGPLFDDMKKNRRIEPIRWFVAAIHSGNSPALHAKVTANWCLSERKDDSPPTLADCDNGQVPRKSPERPLIPGGDNQMAVGNYKDAQPLTLEQWQLDAITNKTKSFYLIGRADYTDTKANPHWTSFCLYYSGENFGMSFCRGGQGTDSD